MSQAAKSEILIPAEPVIDTGSASDFFSLMKPRVMSLVIFTAGIGLFMAPNTVHPMIAIAALAMIALGAGASAALNMWYDADIDEIMTRTRTRPVPSKRLSANDALAFGLWMSGISVFCIAVMVNYLSAGLLAFTIFFYAVIYTMWLKRATPQNIVIGGAAGALPPVIGWAAAANSISLEPLIFFAIIFFWTPPHFWALALIKQDEYRSVGIPMLPITHGERNTRWQIVIYSFVLVAVSFAPAYFGFSGSIYLTTVAVLNVAFLGFAFWLFSVSDERRNMAAGWLFGYSIFYLFALFACLPIDRLFGAL